MSLNENNNNSNKKKKSSKKDFKSKDKNQPTTSAVVAADSNDLFEMNRVENEINSNESESDYTENLNKSSSKRKILSKSKRKSETTMMTNETTISSFAIVGQSKLSKETNSKRKDSKKNTNLKNDNDSLENVNLIEARIDHSLVNESINSENEEMPLVGTTSKKSYHKKKSSHSSITLLNQKIKNQSTPPLKPQNQSNTQNSMTTPLIMPINDSQATVGLENEGFNETMM